MAHPSPTVLIIDDSVGVCTAVAMMLERGGYTVAVAYTYQQGLRAATDGNYSLLLIDVTLGRESGLDLAVEILRQNVRSKIILTSGLYDLTPYLEAYPTLINTPVLPKPFELQKLLDCVRETLGEAAA